MIEITSSEYHKIYTLYLSNKFFFPLIAGVLLNKQHGLVYVDNLQNPRQIYVEHFFGFAQIFGDHIIDFESKLENYLFKDKAFSAEKIRFYGTTLPLFLKLPQYNSLRSYRQRFVLGNGNHSDDIVSAIQTEITITKVNLSNIELIDNKFKIATRFWHNINNFMQFSNAVVVFYQGEPASICYSACEANNQSEIDVFTLPEFRNLGLAKLAVLHYIELCFSLCISPLWDCFTNNTGSMRLCESVGFIPCHPPYSFYTINKQDVKVNEQQYA